MIYILPGNVVARVLHLSAGLVTTTPVSPLFGLGVVVIVFLAVVTGHLEPFECFTDHRKLLTKDLLSLKSNLDVL